MRSLVGPVPEPAERASSALRRCPRATLLLDPAPAPPSPAPPAPAPPTPARPAVSRFTAPFPASPQSEVSLVHQVPDTADLWVALPMADVATVGFGGVRARLEVLDEITGGAAEGRCRRIVVVEGLLEQPGVRAQRRTAAEIAGELPDPVLLDVGATVALVRLRADRIVLTDSDGVTSIDPEDLATSGPDPFADLEGHWLDHLNDPRCQVVPRLAIRVCRCLPAERPLLVGIDRVGVDIELVGRDGRIHRERLPFSEECASATELGTQLRLLAGGSRYPLDRAALRP